MTSLSGIKNNTRPVAILESDSDAISAAPGALFTCWWIVKNAGRSPWPDNCVLVFVGNQGGPADQKAQDGAHS